MVLKIIFEKTFCLNLTFIYLLNSIQKFNKARIIYVNANNEE